ncbi:hypothetical protein M3Y94_00738800 [Aphelenchoides besseyi]|nr:hypothetical protein M3Y94_00735400 [Aphelenchoides besseyi]KAI6204967.1 hypothetical protein M3Y94_00738800 [Aphelenchoides besseyi]
MSTAVGTKRRPSTMSKGRGVVEKKQEKAPVVVKSAVKEFGDTNNQPKPPNRRTTVASKQSKVVEAAEEHDVTIVVTKPTKKTQLRTSTPKNPIRKNRFDDTLVGARELSFVSVSSIDPPTTSFAQLKSTAPPIFVEPPIPKRQSKKPAVENVPVITHQKPSKKSNVGDSIAANVRRRRRASAVLAIDRIFESSLNGEAAKRLASKQKTTGAGKPTTKKSVARKSTGAQRQKPSSK